MDKDVRVYRDKVWLSGETKDKLLHLANGMGVEPDEAFRRAIDRGYELWVIERRKRDRAKRRRRIP